MHFEVAFLNWRGRKSPLLDLSRRHGAEMAPGNVEGEHGGVGDVEARDRAGGRQPGEAIASVAGEAAEPLALATQDERDALARHGLIERLDPPAVAAPAGAG